MSEECIAILDEIVNERHTFVDNRDEQNITKKVKKLVSTCYSLMIGANCRTRSAAHRQAMSSVVLPDLMENGQLTLEQVAACLELVNNVSTEYIEDCLARCGDGVSSDVARHNCTLISQSVDNNHELNDPVQENYDEEEIESDDRLLAINARLEEHVSDDTDDDVSVDDFPNHTDYRSSERDDEQSDESETELSDKSDENVNKKSMCKSGTFFDREEMENFIDKTERKEMKRARSDGESESDSDSMTNQEGPDSNAMYDEFFDKPGSPGGLTDHPSQSDEETIDPRFRAAVSNLPSNINAVQNETDGEKDDDSNLDLTSHERRLKQLTRQISNMEDSAVQPKTWELSGEILADARPENSLIEHHFDYDNLNVKARRQTNTEDLSNALERMIVNRIKCETFDDVERRICRTNDIKEHKRKLVQDAMAEIDAGIAEAQSKRAKSLADVYEEEYLRQKRAHDCNVDKQDKANHSVNPLLDANRLSTNAAASSSVQQCSDEASSTIQAAIKDLFARLDTLTHNRLSREPSGGTEFEVKLVKSDATHVSEDIAPVASRSNVDSVTASLLTASETLDLHRQQSQINVQMGSNSIRSYATSIVGQAELSVVDKKRTRRKKKRMQHKRAVTICKLPSNSVGLSKRIGISKSARQKKSDGHVRTGADVFGSKFTKRG